MNGDNDVLSEDFVSDPYAQASAVQNVLPWITCPENSTAYQRITSDGQPHEKEQCKESSLAVEPGRGSIRVSYPPTIHVQSPAAQTSSLSISTPGTNLPQTGRVRIGSDSSGTHSPDQEASPYGSPSKEKTQALALPNSISETSVRSDRAYRHTENKAMETSDPSTGVAKAFSKWQAGVLESNATSQIRPIEEVSPQISAPNNQTQALALPDGTLGPSLRSDTTLPTAVGGNEAVASEYDFLPAPSHPAYEGISGREALYDYIMCPEYADFNSRLLSFKNGREDTGIVDRVYCFKCGESMHSFEPEDIPTTEHVKHYPDCYQKYWI